MSHKTWGGRFKKALDAKVIAFNESLSFDIALYHYDILGSQAHNEMLLKQGLLTEKEANKISAGLTEIEQEIRAGKHALDCRYEDVHMFVEQLLVAKIGEVGKKLHTGRSRNDQVALDLRLYCKEMGTQVLAKLHALLVQLAKLIAQYGQQKLPGYTHLQQAQPITLGSYFGAYSAMFTRDLDRFQDWQKRMNFSPLGAGALAGSRLPLDRQFVAEKLGFAGVIENTLDAVSDRDYIIEFHAAASLVMMHCSRLSEDLILWATQEFNFITLDDAFATGSSLMPNKKNPDVLELIRGKSGRVFGNLFSMLTVMKGLPLAYNKDMQEDKEGLFDTSKTLCDCLDILPDFLASLSFNIDRMQKQSSSGYLNATYVLETLVLQGKAFRDAHHQVGEWVVEAMDKQLSLAELLEQKGIKLEGLS